ncbi:MAG: alpha/beta hydrolase [Anaerolineae bacterium]|nr:alpha/beta hydrolase [Anaerolineae bacterium]
MDFDTLYADVPADQRQALRQFRADHPPRSITVAGTPWTYLTAGPPDGVPLLWLVGGLRTADAAWRSIPLLADEFRILAPDYAPLPALDALCAGLAAVLDAEGIAAAHVLGGSFGGMVAQQFARDAPGRVLKLILSTTAAPDPAAAEKYRAQLELVAAAPEALLREAAQAQLYDTIAPPPEEAAFWRAYLRELFTQRLDKSHLLSTYHCLIDFLAGRHYTPADLADWHGRLLLIDSDDDATFPPAMQQRLRDLYPAARTHTFHGAGHSPGSTQRQAYFDLVRGFLRPD